MLWHWQCSGTGNALALAMLWHWQCSGSSSGNALALALAMLWLWHGNALLSTLGGRKGKVVASHAEDCKLQDRIPAVAEARAVIQCTRRSGGTAHEVGGATSQLDRL